MEQQPGISSVTLSSRVPSGRLLDSQDAAAEVDGELKDVNLRIADVHVDHNYLSTFGIPMVAGRDFDYNRASDSTEAFILNEAAVMAVGWPNADEAVGKAFNYGGRDGQIIGVVRDFHFESLHQTIAPIVFMVTSGRANTVTVKYNSEKEDEVISYLQEQWTYFRPDNPFDYTEVASRFDAQYESEERLSTLITWFSILAVAIASLGLFGLATFVAERRTKELGIRKVMGASAWQLLVLLTRSFTILVIIAFLIAAPVAYFGLEEWLNGFAYRMEMGIWPFVIGGMLAIGIAWFTISWQTVRAARNNPVDSLRYE
jgi:putative ABC transport system permease protein